MLWPYEISHFTLAEVCNIPLFDLFGGANKSIEKRNDIYNICIICLPLGNHQRWRPLERNAKKAAIDSYIHMCEGALAHSTVKAAIDLEAHLT
jgi:hypothetical protein